MQKDFDGWNVLKKRIDYAEEHKFYSEREIRWCSLGTNIGFEQDGTSAEYQRPVLILRGISRETCFVIPLTTSTHRHRLRVPVGLVDGKYATALMSQMRLIDTKRLGDKISFLDKQIFEFIRETAKAML